jgi:hypothetical protein
MRMLGLRSGWTPLSCEFAFYHAQRRAGRPPNKGALLSAMLDTLREDGQPTEMGWPYLPATPNDPASWAPPAAVGVLFGRDGEKTAASVDDVIRELDVGRPVIILLMLSASFYRPGPGGLIHPAPNEGPEPERRHAVIAWATVRWRRTAPFSFAIAGASAGPLAATAGSPSLFLDRGCLRRQSLRRRSMYLPVSPQPDCASAWREAVRVADAQPHHEAYNVIIDVADPTANANRQDPRVAVVDDFLSGCDKSVETVANTIFPAGLYYRHGAPAFFDVFRERVLQKVRRNERWSGYYFERMINYPVPAGQPQNQLWDIVERMRSEQVRALNKYELSLFDPLRDVDNSPYGGQCLGFISFKVIPGQERILTLTAMYRNHFYIEKLLGNLIGLGRLIAFVAHEAGLKVGALTVISTHAEIDLPNRGRRSDLAAMIARFDQAAALPAV